MTPEEELLHAIFEGPTVRDELAQALHEGRDHTRDGVSLGHAPICNCYLLADKALASPVIARISAEAWDEGMQTARQILLRRFPQHYETDIDLLSEGNPYERQPSNDRQEPDRG